MEPIHTLLPMLPQLLLLDTESPMLQRPEELLVLPQLSSPLLLELMLELADMLPTAPELSMLPRERLRLSPRLMPTTTVPTVMVPSLPTDTEATDMDTHMPTMERDLLMPRLSQRLMLTMVSTDMVPLLPTDTEATDMDTPPMA